MIVRVYDADGIYLIEVLHGGFDKGKFEYVRYTTSLPVIKRFKKEFHTINIDYAKTKVEAGKRVAEVKYDGNEYIQIDPHYSLSKDNEAALKSAENYVDDYYAADLAQQQQLQKPSNPYAKLSLIVLIAALAVTVVSIIVVYHVGTLINAIVKPVNETANINSYLLHYLINITRNSTLPSIGGRT